MLASVFNNEYTHHATVNTDDMGRLARETRRSATCVHGLYLLLGAMLGQHTTGYAALHDDQHRRNWAMTNFDPCTSRIWGLFAKSSSIYNFMFIAPLLAAALGSSKREVTMYPRAAACCTTH